MITSCSQGISHSVGFSCQCIDNQLLVILSPPSHLRVRFDDMFKIIGDVLPLSAFVVKGHVVGSQMLERRSNVDLWTTCDTNPYMRKSQGVQFFDKLQKLFA